MLNIPEIRERIADHIEKTLSDELITITTEYQPVAEITENESLIAIQPVSLSAIFVDRARYSVEPKISITISKRIGESREESGDYVLEIAGKVINATLGIGFNSAIVKTIDISDPILLEDSISGQNVAASRLILSLYAMEDRTQNG